MNTYGEQLISHLNEILSIITTLFIFAAKYRFICYCLVNIKTTAELTRVPSHISPNTYMATNIDGYISLICYYDIPIVTLTENRCYSVCKHDNFPYCKQIEAVSKVWFVFQTRMEMFNVSDFLSKFLISTHLTMYTKLKDQNKIGLVKLISEEEKNWKCIYLHVKND